MSAEDIAKFVEAGATVIAALVGGLLAWWINHAADRRREQNDHAADRRRAENEHETQILKALEFLTGGTQSRSAGIGLLEGLFKESAATSPLRPIFLPVIRNQLIYLSTSSSPKRELHEHDNFFRLADIWNRLRPSPDECLQLREALELRDPGNRGLEFTDTPYDQKFEAFRVSIGLAPATLDHRTQSPA